MLVRGDRIFLAMADPHEKRVVDELEFVTGKKVYSYIAVHSTLVKAIAAAYDAKARGERHYLGPQVPAETLRQLGIARPRRGPSRPPRHLRRCRVPRAPEPAVVFDESRREPRRYRRASSA